MKRVVRGLRWARMCERPPCIPQGRARGAKGKGVAYERQLAAFLPHASYGQWFEFEDSSGLGYCQVDLLLPDGDLLICLEAKYTWTMDAHRELRDLYLPVVGEVTRKEVRGVVVCKVLTPYTLHPRSTSIEDMIYHASVYEQSVWHWLGSGVRARPSRPPLRRPKVLAVDELLSRRLA